MRGRFTMKKATCGTVPYSIIKHNGSSIGECRYDIIKTILTLKFF